MLNTNNPNIALATITAKKVIKLVTAPYFLAAKIEAFEGHGQNDYLASQDLEDIITVIGAHPEIIEEVRAVEQVLNYYLREKLTDFLHNEDFLDALPGHLQDERQLDLIFMQVLFFLMNKKSPFQLSVVKNSLMF
jgi:hypothetical protein